MADQRKTTGSTRVYFVLGVFSAALLGAMGHIMLLGARVGDRYVPLARKSEQVMINTTLAHLWLEEILGGDRQESIEEVRARLREARTGLRAMVEGAEDVVPLDDPRLAAMARRVQEKLAEFEDATEERWDSRRTSASGTRIDQAYDTLFREFIAMAEAVELEVHELIRGETRRARRTQWWVLAGTVGLLIFAGLLFGRYSRQRVHVEGILRKKVRAETEARRHLEDLAHVVRLSTMSELVAGIAHEVNQPLAAISASASACRRLAASGRAGSTEHRTALELIESEALRASAVVSRLRAFVAKRESEYEVLDVNDLVGHIVSLGGLDPEMRRAKIRVALAEDLPRVEADSVQIQQVLLNLLRNGIEATGACEGEQPVITVCTRVDSEGDVEVSVADRGPGVPQDVSGRAFDPFFTTKADGMGMGLSISHSIVMAHGGRIWFDSNLPEPGATFRFTLPAVRGGEG